MQLIDLKRGVPFLVIAGITLLVVLVLLQLKNPISVDDGLRHFVMGKALLTGAITHQGWQPFFSSGYLSNHAVDPWYLSNILLGLLSPLGLQAALATYSTIMLVATLVTVWLLLRNFPLTTTAQSILLIWLFALQPNFLYRVLLPRPYTLITILSLLVLWAVLQRRAWLLLPLVALSVLTSQLCVFPVAFMVAGAVWLCCMREYGVAVKIALYSAAGVLIGLLLHPTPLAYLEYLYTVFLRIPFLSAQVGPSSEMQSEVLFSPFAILAIMGISVGTVRVRQSELWPQYVRKGMPLLFALAAIFFLLFLRFGRAIDFLWPLCIVALGAVWSARETLFTRISARLRVLVVVFLLAISLLNTVGISHRLLATDAERDLAPITVALQAVPPQARLLNPDWQLFAPALAVRSDLRYATGIDPVFSYLHDPQGYRYLRQMPSDDPRDVESWLVAIQQHFPADFLVLLRPLHLGLIKHIQAAGYQDQSTSDLLAVFNLAAAK